MTANVITPVVRAPAPKTRAPILRKIGQRLLQLIVVVAVLVVGTALLVRLIPGDPATAILGLNATPESIARLRQELGLDRPVLQQILDQLGGLLRGDFGTSTQQGRPVLELIGQAMPVTMSLVLVSTVFAIAISLPLGLLPAFGIGPRGVRRLRLAMIVLITIPSFLVGLYLILIVAIQLRLAPAGGWSPAFPDVLRYVWLPSLALALFMVPILVRAVERSTSQLVGEEFVEAAISRGLPRRTLVFRHVLPNVLLPVITLVGFSVSVLIGSAVIVESVFGIPGFGQLIVTAVSQRDYPVILGTTLFTGVVVVLVNLVTDLLYTVADPRTRTQ